MLGFDNQVWVTSVISDEDVQRALVLCYSLRRSYTSRRIAVIASPKISPHLKEALHYVFDLIFYLEETLNVTHLNSKDYSKLYCLMVLRSFEKCAYLSPSMVALKNCDDIFSKTTESIHLLEEDENAVLFLFKPSLDIFKSATKCLTGLSINEIDFGLGSHLKKWLEREYQHVDFLSAKYNKVVKPGKPMIGFDQDISIINLIDYPGTGPGDSEEYGETGLFGKLIAIYVQKILRENVAPILETCTSNRPLFSSSVQLISTVPSYKKEPIAIVGMSCRYPGSNNLEEFWELLFQGKDGTCSPPPFRWMREQCSMHKANARNTNAGFLKVPVDEFDAKFFGVSPKEVLFMDPQHRLLHEVVWEGLEDACMDPHSLRGTSGSVFLGSWTNSYNDIVMSSTIAEFYRAYMGNSIGAAAARISFLLGMTGPSISTESGCSSAMVAVHLACKSLRNGETNVALAGGVNLLLHPFDQELMPMVVSPDGRCKTFSEDANGFARAEGCGVLVLKRLSDALKDGDNIWGLIRGTAVSQEGISKSMGTPTIECESLAMQNALKDGEVRPEQVSYIETHGTGTVVGDPVEVAAISKAYKSPLRKEPLVIGSVKTNVGHTESCSGITGVMKVVLSMFHERIPAHLNFSKLNTSINLEQVPAIIPLHSVEWKKVLGKPRIAGVSSFGITGTDAHVIVEEPPQMVIPPKALTVGSNMERPVHILKISAKTDEALELLLERFQGFVEASQEELSDIAYSVNCGRANFSNRVAIIAKSKQDVVACIQKKKYLKGEADSIGKICFLFTGQGSQYPGMAKQLYESSPVFQMHFDYCNNILNKKYNITLKRLLWSGNPSQDEISRTINSQTSIFCVEYALLKLWESWGVKPDYALGHSLGEFAAAVCAGIISVEDAITLVAERSRLIDDLPRGKMLVIQADYDEVQTKLKEFAGNDAKRTLDYAAINSSEQTVVAGDSEIVMEFSRFLTDLKVKCTVLAATHAFHSKHMDPMLDSYRNVAKTVRKGNSVQSCQLISGMKGFLVQPTDVDADYWVQHTRERVNFFNASKQAVELGCQIFIEIGPQPVLSALTMTNNNESSLLCVPSLKSKSNDWDTILNTLGKLYVKGVEIDWSGLDQFFTRRKIRLPHYPFIGKKFWPDILQVGGNLIHPLVGSVIPNASSTKIFQCGVNLRSHEYIKDHAIGQTAIFPGAGYLEMSLAAGLATVEGSVETLGKPCRPMKVENLMIKAPLALHESSTVQMQTVVELNTSEDNQNDWNDVTVKIFHRQESDSLSKWIEHATATFSPIPTAEELQEIRFDKNQFFKTLAKPLDPVTIAQVYQKLVSVGLKFGQAFRSIENLWENEDQTTLLAKVKLPQEENGQCGQYIIHPVVLDAMIQAIVMTKLKRDTKVKLFVPIKIGKLLWLSNSTDNSEQRYIHVSNSTDASSTRNAMALLLDRKGNVLAVMSKVECIDTTVKTVESVLEQQTSKMPDLWEESWRPKVGPSQYRYPLSLHTQTCFYDDNFKEELDKMLNNFSRELQETVYNLEQLTFLNYIRCLYECGWKPALNDEFTQEHLQNVLKIQPEFGQLFTHLLQVLEQEKILKRKLGKSSSWQVTQIPPTLSNVQDRLLSPPLNSELVKRFKSTLIYQRVGQVYSKILTGVQAPLPVLFPEEGPSVTGYYADHGIAFKMDYIFTSVVACHLNHLKSHYYSEERKILRILEIGAGTGSFTKKFIELMIEEGIEFEYTFTDISPAFFAPAEKLLEAHLPNLKFKKLNIEEDPLSQGFIPNYYDWILASDVIHATKNVKEALVNVRMLLRSGGTFDLIEQTKVSRFLTFLFGLLDGFWRFEDFELRLNHCTLSNEKWIECLQNCGFQVVGSFLNLNNAHAYISTYKCPNYTENSFSQSQLSLGSCSKSSNQLWILFHHDTSPVSNYLLSTIPTVNGRQIIVVRRGERFSYLKSKQEWRIELNEESEEDFCQLMNYVESSGEGRIEGIAWCWSLDKTRTTQNAILKPYFSMIKSVFKMTQSESPKMTVFVNGVAAVEDNDLSHFHPSTIWGFIKALRNERTDLPCRSVDIGAKEDEMDVGEQAFYELWNSDTSIQIAYSGNTRFTPKFQSVKPSLSDLKLPRGSDRFQLVLPETKAIADLQFGPLEPSILESGQIEVLVKASALNFKDIFNILKPSDEFKDSNAVGFDFAGVVKRIGANVTKCAIGDMVFGLNTNNNALPSHVKLDENDVIRVPQEMTLPDACTLTTVYATSYHCLIEVANITPKDIVLIHTASGGVGLSAIQICKSVGAKVIATAGSKRKQNYLRSVGIEHVFHSRNTKYGDEILELTNGRGVDVVLNSLTSEGFKEATLKVCAKGARFVEMSKLSIWQPSQVKKLRPDVDYTIADLSAMDQFQWRTLLSAINDLSKRNAIKPIPYVRFDGVHIREALQYMQKAKHIGKVVCVLPEVKQRNGIPEVFTPIFNENATYLITGGLGGIGFVVCKWMLEKGAKYILLGGRSVASEAMKQSVNTLNSQYSSYVKTVQLDVSNFDDCKEVLQVKIQQLGWPSLRGVMHAAGILRDGLVENHSWDTLSSTFGSKVDGTLNLHLLTKDLNLEHFVVFSSMASLLGSPGQCNHSAGNNFEDALVHFRHSIGLPATTVNWSQWGQVGIATEVDIPGVKSISNVHGISALEYILKSQRTQTGVLMVESFALMVKLFPYVSSVIDESVWKAGSSFPGTNAINLTTDEFWQQYDNLDNNGSKMEYLRNILSSILRNILKLDATDVIGDDANFQEMGVDSLMFVEIKNALQHLLGDRAVVSASALRDSNTIALLTEALLNVIEGEQVEEGIPTAEEVQQLIQEDCYLPEHIKTNANQKKVNVENISTVLLTGCSGTLGVYVLMELTKSVQVTQVVCLMRPNKNISGEDRLKNVLHKRELISEIDMSKIKCVSGNVAEHHFGMEPSLWAELSNSVDAVFHCAAKVNHVEQYRKRDSASDDVRAVNVGGMKNVLEFACSGEKLKQVYCASSMLSVNRIEKDGSFSEDWPESTDFDGLMTLAYPITKFVEDMLMKQAVLERGIPGKIFRFPMVMGDSKTGRFVLENNHTMLRYFFILKNGIMPTNPLPLPFLSVDICAWASVQIFLNPDAPNDVFNVCNKCPQLDQDFVFVAKKLGYNVDLVEFAQFGEKIRAAENSGFAIFQEFYKNDDDVVSLFSNYKVVKHWVLDGGSDESYMVSKKIKSLLPEFYSESKCIRDELYRDMLYAKRQGWFEKFGSI